MNSKLIGKPFNIKTANCYHFIQSQYPNLPDIKYKELTAEEFLAIALYNDFYLVDRIQDVNKGDVFITRSPDVHLMYYNGEQLISHHPRGKLALTEYLNGEMISNIKYIVRSKYGTNN